MRSHRRAGPLALASVAAALALGTGLFFTPSVASGAASRRPSLVLDGQSQWVTPATPGASGTFDLDLSTRSAPAGAQVAVALFPRLDSRDRFEDVVEHGPRGNPISETAPVPLSQLPADTHAPGGAGLNIQVSTSQSTGDGERLGLDCAGPTATGTCTGVYPVTVSLLDASGVELRHFTTFLTYSAGTSATPLEFALVVPISSPVTVDRGAKSAASAIAPLSRSQAAALDQTVAALRAASTVPVTVAVSPQTLQALRASGPDGRSAVTALVAMSANQAVDEIPPAPYVPVNLASLAGAGESTELAAQMAAGQTVLDKLRVQTATSLTWVAATAVGDTLGSGLSRVGATAVVVPGASLAPTPDAPPYTWASTFKLALGSGAGTAVDAAESDTFLDGQFRGAAADPALSASQMLADLAMVHFERPNTPTTRGMVAVPPTGWTLNAAFERTLLAGLDGNPVVTPVTLNHFLSSVDSSGTRTLQSPATRSALGRSGARSLSAARLRLTEFDHMVLGKPAILGQLDRVLLAAESDRLVSPSEPAAVAVFEHLLSAQLHLVSFTTKSSYTLTARTGDIPITIESRARYAVVGTLVVSGAKFVFPGRASEAKYKMVLDHAVNPWRVSVEARSSGDLPLHVAFTSPSGRLVVATGGFTVRSTATSLVGVVLTALALAVLLAWWVRTWRTRRRARRRAREPEERPEQVEVGAR